MSGTDESDSEETNISFLKHKRKYMRSETTKINTKIDAEISTLTVEEKLRLIARIEKLSLNLEKINQKIFKCLFKEKAEESVTQTEYDSCLEYDAIISSCISTLKSDTWNNESDASGANFNGSRSALKLPQVPLPEYGNLEGEDLHKFFLNFENVIDKYKLSPYEKFIYLKRQLSNEPLTIIKSLEIGKQTYNDAKDLLQRAFASVVTQQYRAIKQLSELKMNRNDDPYVFISNMRMLTESFDTLNINTDIVLQYFFWNAMNEEMQQLFIGISNASKPDLSQMKQYTFDVAERYLLSPRRSKSVKESTQVSAASVNYHKESSVKPKRKYCSLCTGKGAAIESHNSYECKKFVTAEEKLDRLKHLNGCLKCGNLSHVAKDCRFQFKHKCARCNCYHFTYLCKDTVKSNENKKEHIVNKKVEQKGNKFKTETSIQSGSVFIAKIDVQHYGEDSIIPTFSVKYSRKHTIRCMRDSGCQPNLITFDCAKKLNLKSISDQFPLNINGFNQSTKHNVKVVELKLNPKFPPIKTICVPTINVKLKLPGLSELAHSFKEKGYSLADEFVSNNCDEISNLDVVLGNNDAHILPQIEVLFGSRVPSVYSQTPNGVMLMGSIHRLRENLEELPDLVAPSKCEIKSCGLEVECDSEPSTIRGGTYFAYDGKGNVDEKMLTSAAEDIIKQSYFFNNQYLSPVEINENESDSRISKYVLENTCRAEDGRLMMPLLWKDNMAHLLASNFNLSKKVLKSNLKRLQNDPIRLRMYDQVIDEQVKLGIVERVPDLEQFLTNNPTTSFLPHMGVFRMNHDTTKCRVVYLSNLSENNPEMPHTISHNQAMLSGPNLNRKIMTAVIKLRFDKHLLCFDLKKAFLTIAVPPIDQSRLLFLWYRNVEKNDFSIAAYKNLRLPFGLRCSPALLMLGMYKILMLDVEDDTEPVQRSKRLIYDLLYMDNGCITTNSLAELNKSPELLQQIFEPYQFKLQQFVTNDLQLQNELDAQHQQETAKEVKLFGLRYDREKDTLSTMKLHLDPAAATKRKILASLASNFDLLQFAGPILNRARLFVHGLQCSQDVGWDDVISDSQEKEWRCISKQLNAAIPIKIERFVGDRDGAYRMIAFTDASKVMVGAVLYVQELNTNKVSFMLAKNRIIGRQLESKSIPALELHAVSFGIDTLMDVYNELTSQDSVVPINIKELHLFSDSMVALNWINKHVNKLDKMQKCATFVLNRLESISRSCTVNPVTFHFISGLENPADVITRPVSYKQLIKSNFHSGPQNLSNSFGQNDYNGISFKVPNPFAKPSETEQFCVELTAIQEAANLNIKNVLSFQDYSSFQKLIRVYRNVVKYGRIWKEETAKIRGTYDRNAKVNSNSFVTASMNILRTEQQTYFHEVFEYLSGNHAKKFMPNIVGQLNLFKDKEGVLRVRSKFKEWSENTDGTLPILLPRDSPIVEMIVNDYHHRLAHSGCFSVLSQVRKQFHIPKPFETVKKILKECITCKKQNCRTIKLNQSFYRDFREKPASVPYRDVFIDHFGPFYVDNGTKKVKVWILCVTCLWSRAINLKVCYDLTVNEFLRTFQLHVFEYGIAERVFSDLGTQLVAGANIITDLLKDVSTQLFFDENNVKSPSFSQFFKGHKALGSLVESCVKLTKRILYGSIGKNVLPHLQFELFVAQTVSIVNKRPIAFRETLRENQGDDPEVPAPISPELLLKGYNLTTLCIIPSNHPGEYWVPSRDPVDEIRTNYKKLEKVRENLINLYHDEFISSLIYQATNKKDRYKPVKHKTLNIGDVVLLKEDNMKRINFPLGIVQKVFSNDLGEITSAEIRKGRSGEVVKRHVSSLIPILSSISPTVTTENGSSSKSSIRTTEKRAAAVASSERTKNMLERDLV